MATEISPKVQESGPPPPPHTGPSPKFYHVFTPSLSGKFYDEIKTYLGDGDNACSYSNKLEISLCLILSRANHELDVKA